jgi:calcineurin-like phosphoesterase family protein
MNDIFFTADTHFGHGRIIQYCNRPVATYEEMDEMLIRNINSVVKKGDTLYHLGDVSWSTWPLKTLFRLNTKQMFLVKGNHDNLADKFYKPYFVWVGDLKHIHIGDKSVELCHYPLRTWKSKGHGGIHLHGHCHGNLPSLDRSMDVGVDCNGYLPVAWETIWEKLKDLPMYSDLDGRIV